MGNVDNGSNEPLGHVELDPHTCICIYVHIYIDIYTGAEPPLGGSAPEGGVAPSGGYVPGGGVAPGSIFINFIDFH